LLIIGFGEVDDLKTPVNSDSEINLLSTNYYLITSHNPNYIRRDQIKGFPINEWEELRRGKKYVLPCKYTSNIDTLG